MTNPFDPTREAQPLTLSLVQTMVVMATKAKSSEVALLKEDWERLSERERREAEDYAARWSVDLLILSPKVIEDYKAPLGRIDWSEER